MVRPEIAHSRVTPRIQSRSRTNDRLNNEKKSYFLESFQEKSLFLQDTENLSFENPSTGAGLPANVPSLDVPCSMSSSRHHT